MGLLDRIFGGGRKPEPKRDTRPNQYGGHVRGAQSEDEAAIARYQYMLKTAPPETIEQAHAEAFAKLTPPQRQMVLKELYPYRFLPVWSYQAHHLYLLYPLLLCFLSIPVRGICSSLQ